MHACLPEQACGSCQGEGVGERRPTDLGRQVGGGRERLLAPARHHRMRHVRHHQHLPAMRGSTHAQAHARGGDQHAVGVHSTRRRMAACGLSARLGTRRVEGKGGGCRIKWFLDPQIFFPPSAEHSSRRKKKKKTKKQASASALPCSSPAQSTRRWWLGWRRAAASSRAPALPFSTCPTT